MSLGEVTKLIAKLKIRSTTNTGTLLSSDGSSPISEPVFDLGGGMALDGEDRRQGHDRGEQDTHINSNGWGNAAQLR
jgi:hypothetical protein